MPVRTKCTLARILLLFAPTMLFGCANWFDDTVPVSGKVLVDGKPLTQATVIFFKEELQSRENTIFGVTDNEGDYTLPKGAVPSTYKVVVKGLVTKSDISLPGYGGNGVDGGQQMASTEARMRMSRKGRQTGRVLPPKYSSPQHTTLQIEIPSNGTRTADLNLSVNETANNSAVIIQ